MKKILFICFLFLTVKSFSQDIIQYTTVTSGTVTASDLQQDVQIIHDAGATVTMTVAFPATPFNGQIVGFTSVGGVTNLTLSTSVGSITNALTTAVAGGSARYVYYTSQTKWYKIQ